MIMTVLRRSICTGRSGNKANNSYDSKRAESERTEIQQTAF